MEHERRMSKRDKARRKFVNEFNLKQKQKRGLKNMAETENERFMDMREQIHYQSAKPLKDMKYLELMETLDRDQEALKQLSDPKAAFLQIIKDDKEIAAQKEKAAEELLVKTKKVVYPMYLVGGSIMLLIWYGQLQ